MTVNCNFCGKSQNEVWIVVAGPGVSICNKCVADCKDTILGVTLEKTGVNSLSPETKAELAQLTFATFDEFCSDADLSRKMYTAMEILTQVEALFLKKLAVLAERRRRDEEGDSLLEEIKERESELSRQIDELKEKANAELEPKRRRLEELIWQT